MTATPTPGRSLVPGLAVLGTIELGALAAAGWWPGAHFPFPALLLIGVAVAAYGLGGRAACAGAHDGIRIVWAFALAFRVVLLPLDPVLSDDIYRYLWDGHVQSQGLNPYRFAPAAPELAGIRTSWHGLINNPSVPTIYPPLAQMVFLLGAAVGGTVVVFKGMWILLDLGAGWLLGRVALRSGRPALPVLVLYLWSPLLVVETAWSGHLEALGLFLMALFLHLIPDDVAGRRAERSGDYPATQVRASNPNSRAPLLPEGEPGPGARRLATAGAAAGATLALAALTKLAPAAAFPAVVRRSGWRFAAAFIATVLVLYLPYAGAGSAHWSGLSTYAEHWRANEGVFALFEAFLAGPRAPRLASGVVVLGIVFLATVRRFDPERALFWILGTGLLVSPTVHPWYVLWILPFAALRRSVPWLVLSCTAFVGYWGLGAYQETGQWPQPTWTRLVLWGPLVCLLAVDAWRSARGGEPPHTQPPVP